MVKKNSKVFYQILAVLLCLAMVLPYVPAPVFAANGTDSVYVLAGSDYQGAWVNSAHDTSAVNANIQAILSSAANKGYTGFKGFLFLGDYNLGGDDGTVNGLASLKSQVAGSLASDAHQYYIQGNHDAAATGSNGLNQTTFYENEYFGVYVLNWDDYGANSNEAQVVAQANNLKNILAGRAVGQKPIFVIAHTPLHYSYRTISHGDSRYADYLVDVLNAAGQRGLNIIYMYGHNHSSGYDRYLGGSTNFIGKGETLWVADLDGVSEEPNARSINFTYMNAGYVGSIGDQRDTIDSDQTMSVFEITGDKVTIRRFDKQGEHALQEKPGEWWDYATGTTDATFGCTLDTRTQASGLTVSGSPLALNIPERISTYNFAAGTYADISVMNADANTKYTWNLTPVEGADVASITVDSANSSSVSLNAKNVGTVCLTVTDGNGASASAYIQIVGIAEEMVVETANYSFYRPVNTLTDGKKYMLLNRDEAGSGFAIQASPGGTNSANDYLTLLYPIKVGSYRQGLPFVMKPNVDHLLWVVEGSRIRANQRSSYLAIESINADDVNVVLHKPSTQTGSAYDWNLNYGLQTNVGGVPWYLVHSTEGGGSKWDATKAVDSALHTKVYPYEETPMYAVGEVSDRTGCVSVGAGTAAKTGSYIVKTWSNGRVEYVPLTVSMLFDHDGNAVSTANAGVIENVTVKYNNIILCNDYTLTVGSEKTINVGQYYYYRLTDGFTTNETLSLQHRYLILNRNTKGDGKLMESKNFTGSTMNSKDISVTLDANGVPCVQYKYLTEETSVMGTHPVYEEWWYHKHEDFWYLWQPKLTNDTNDNFLRVAAPGQGNVVSGGPGNVSFSGYTGVVNALRDVTMNSSGSLSGYTSIWGVYIDASNVCGAFVEYDEGSNKFIGVFDDGQNRMTLGQEVYIYEKVSSSTATVSAVGTVGYVNVGSGNTAKTGTRIQITKDDGTATYADVTVSMLSGTYNLNQAGTYKNLTLTYEGVVLTNSYTLVVVDPNAEIKYPAPGSVKVDKVKDTSEFDFDATGVARIDLSTAGVASKQKLDVLVIVDTSSSVTKYSMANGETRLEAMRRSIELLIDDLAQPTADGSLPDIQMAITQFNDYNYFGNVNSLNPPHGPAADGKIDGAYNQTVQDYTDIFDMQNFDTTRLQSKACTNYDVGFRHAYHLVKGRMDANKKAGEDREQVVIFMTDGLCYQYNYISNLQLVGDSRDYYGDDYWERWLTGTLDEAGLVETAVPEAARDWYHPEGKNWMAEAIKGAPGSTYKVIDKTENAYDTGGTYDKATNLQYVNGLGATMYTIGFGLSVEGEEGVEVGRQILTLAASDPSKYYVAEEAEELYEAFRSIGLNVRSASTQAVLYDTMGANFNLQMGAVKDSNGNTQIIRPTITIKGYDLFKMTDVGTLYNGVTVTEAMVGTRKSNRPTVVLETVTFNDAGTEAYSDQKAGNIMVGGIIDAMYFQYNTNKIPDDPLDIGNPQPYYEQLMWNIGTIREQELVLSYYVYLENSMGEDNKGVTDGTYETNAGAFLNYVDSNGVEKSKTLASPVLNWVNAKYNVGFYQVNQNGEPVKANGSTTNFAGKNVVKEPTATEINLNVNYSTGKLEVPEGYVLFDPSAGYTIKVHSGVQENEKDITIAPGGYDNLHWTNGGEWTIASEKEKKTTYVDGYGGSPTTETTKSSTTGDYANTTVWFALVKISILPDVVVIDYGLPVDINVLDNDTITSNFTLYAVGPYNSSLDNKSSAEPADGFVTSGSKQGTYGDYSLNGTKVRFALDTMEMDGYEKFLYAVKYTAGGTTSYYYASVTVIPATTIYFEDSGSFIDYNKLIWTSQVGGQAWEGSWSVVDNGGMWDPDGSTQDKTQAEDRPGSVANDANNIYGYDGAYVTMNAHSLGSAMKATVDYDNGAQASFKFWGTGFDVISVTSADTGTIFVDVYALDANGNRTGAPVKQKVIDTYYGYTYGLYNVTYVYTHGEWIKSVGTAVANGTEKKAVLPANPKHGDQVTGVEYCWVVNPNATGCLYQVPVMEVADLTYGHYEAVIRAVYEPLFDHKNGSTSGSYDFYLDAIRIYDPANDGAKDETGTISGAYKDDHEGWPSYIELRNKLIDKNKLQHWTASTKLTGMVFIDGKTSVKDADISNYTNFGPNNEVYLANGQVVAFMLSCPTNIDKVHLGIKSANGTASSYTIAALNKSNGAVVGSSTQTVSTTTDMYYDITSCKDYVIYIKNNTDGIISITNIKSTYTSNPNNGTMTTSLDEDVTSGETYVYMTKEAATMVLNYLNGKVEDDVPGSDDNTGTNTPEGNNPEQNVPGSPETGDASEQYLLVMTVVLLTSMIAMAAVICFGRKERA